MLSWHYSFVRGEIEAPFTVNSDAEYYQDLRKRLTKFVNSLQDVADEESIMIAKKYSDKVCEALRDYYRGNISSCHQRIQNLVKNCGDNTIANALLNQSRAFPGKQGSEIQFFRARLSDHTVTFKPKEMLHHPFSMRGKTGNYRFSIPGVTSLYLSNSSYGCWIELGCPAEHAFNVSPFVLDGKQRIFNLAVTSNNLSHLESDEDLYCWIKLLVLMIATSYKVEEKNRIFKSEYIVSQSIMLACKKLKYDGVAYYSKRVTNEMFANVAVNLALFADYSPYKSYSEICNHLKVDDSLNYQLFRQLGLPTTKNHYDLRVASIDDFISIGNSKHRYDYRDTEFYRFDEHLFSRWHEKDSVVWGNALIE